MILPLEAARIAVVALVAGVLAIAALSDVQTRRIPNWTVIAIAALFVPWVFVGPHASVLYGLESALAAAAIIFAVTFAFYSLGFCGAGDSKLMSAVALFAGMGHLLQLVVITSLAGGVLAAISLAARPTRALVLLQTGGKGDPATGVPYGAAIALGGVLTLIGILVRVGWPLASS